ncbi:MAG: S-layer homology domain-containing protein, partial [Lawsonibacter sp.]
DSTNLKNWASYLLGVNGFNATFAADKATSVTNVDSRHPEVYTWSKTVSGTEVPMFQWAQCLLRSHNCYPSDIPMMWDFLEHYSFAKGSNGTVTRYYSPSAFVEDDAVKIDPISNTHTGGSGSSSTKQSVVVKSTENGTISANISTAASGTAVTITVTPKSGYELKSLKVSTASGTEVTLTDKGNGQYTFTMPSTAVTITGAFAAIEAKLPYSDVQKGDWFYDAVDFVQEQGLMSGTGTTTFAPNMELSRAMIAQILYKIEQTPTSSGASFTDVAAGQWYSDAIIWASQKGIVSGYGNGQFGPNDSITREQLAAILYSYVQYKKPGTTATGSLDAFRDGASASDWAKESLIWAVNQGLMSGKTGNILDPKGTATRAEVAQILMKFLETE